MRKTVLTLAIGSIIALAGSIGFAAECKEKGKVESVSEAKKEGEGTGLGAVVGGVGGALLGSQVGSGRGQTAATVAGAAGGAYVGHQVEKKAKADTSYLVKVKMTDGSTRTLTYGKQPAVSPGESVCIRNGKLISIPRQ